MNLKNGRIHNGPLMKLSIELWISPLKCLSVLSKVLSAKWLCKPTACVIIDSTKVDAGKLKALEEILYGKDPTGPETEDGVDPRLPLPDEIITLMTPAG